MDAVYLRGTAVQATPGVLAGLGWRPAFAFSRMRADVPLAQELFLPSRVGDWNLVAAFQAVCAAASLEMALVLPAVVPATVLAWWRRGCDQLDDESAVRAAAAAAGLHPTDAGQLATQLASVALDTNAMLSLRALLADRYHFRPI
jgi:hypothetical protein